MRIHLWYQYLSLYQDINEIQIKKVQWRHSLSTILKTTKFKRNRWTELRVWCVYFSYTILLSHSFFVGIGLKADLGSIKLKMHPIPMNFVFLLVLLLKVISMKLYVLFGPLTSPVWFSFSRWLFISAPCNTIITNVCMFIYCVILF